MRDQTTSLRPRLTRRQLVSSGAAATLAVATAFAWPARCNGKFYPGATLMGIDLGGLSRAEARDQLQDQLASFEAHAITYRLGDHQWHASANELGVSVDYEASLDGAWAHGRDDGLRGRYTALLREQPVIEPLELTLDTVKLDRFLASIDQDVAEPARDATLFVKRGRVQVKPHYNGSRLDIEDARHKTLAALKSARTTDLELQTVRTPPAITEADLENAKSMISLLVGSEVSIVHGDSTWTLSPAELTDALRIPQDPQAGTVRLDAATIARSLAPIADAVNHLPRNASVAWDGGLYATSESYDGATVDLERLADDVIAAAATTDRSVNLPLIYTPPAVDSAHLDALGITTRIGRGASSFSGSSAARATNVAVAAEHVSHKLIPPGSTFSFNDALGPITMDEGYVEGKIILGDWYASDLGGGVCQVSTTVFRAALLAGLPFGEWHPHSFRLGFYELDGWPVGMDAAIYQPNNDGESELDLLFSNPTDSWMLLQMAIDGETVVASLYGAKPAFQVEISPPHVGEPVAPPNAIERPSAQLQSGEREQIQIAQPGLTVTMTRQIVSGDQVIAEDTFISPYQAQPDVYLVGQTPG